MTNLKNKWLKKYLKQSNEKSKAPFSFVYYGNVFTKEKDFVKNGNITADTYIRYASMTKIIGMCLLAKANEDGLIKSVNDPVYTYVPEIIKITQYIDSATQVQPPEVDKYGTPKFEMKLVDDPELGKKILIKHLYENNSGLGYSFFGVGSMRDLYVNSFTTVPAAQKYIAWLQHLEANNVYLDTLTASYFKKPQTDTEYINERVKYPLLFEPGTDHCYDTGLTWIGAVIGGALRKNGINKTSAEYCKEVLFDKLNMKSVWLCAGALSPPCDVIKNLSRAFFVRNNNIDGQKGPNTEFNTLYNVFNINAKDDGYQHQMLQNNIIKKPKNSYLKNPYAGGYSSSGLGSIKDFCKILKMLIRKGANKNGEQVLSKQNVEWILTPKFTNTTDSMWLLGKDTVNLLDPGFTWCGGVSKYIENKINPDFKLGPNTYAWGGYYGTSFYFDTESGYYMLSGTQASGSSYLITSSPFQPPRYEIWQMITTESDNCSAN